jgi:glycine oxidase
MSATKRYLIVGAGVAGVCLAQQLKDKGQHITIVDNNQNKSSVVAAGMINPLVFRRMTKSWRIDEFLPFGYSFYQDMERKLGTTFFHRITIRRIFSSVQELGFWELKQDLPEFSEYMEPLSKEDYDYLGANNPYGTGRVKGAAYIDTDSFIAAFRNYFQENDMLLNAPFIHSSFDPEKLTFQNSVYDGVIFCEGYLAFKNPLFQNIPIQCTKGETITIDCPELKTKESLNRKCFVLPLKGKNHYRVGATYVWNTPDNNQTPEGRNELIEKFRVVSNSPFEIIDQQTGVRPTTPDRRPIIGAHEGYKHIYIFNGLGTKGYMSAPLLAKELCDHILEGRPLDPEVSISRFKKS